MVMTRDIIHRPADHVKRASGPLMFAHKCVRRDRSGAMLLASSALLVSLALTGVVTLIALAITYFTPGGVIDWSRWMLYGNAALAPLLSYVALTLLASSNDENAWKSFNALAKEARKAISLTDRELGDALDDLMQRNSDDTTDLRRVVSLRLAETQMQYASASRQAGTADKGPLLQVRDETLRAIAESAVTEHDGIRQIVAERDADKARTALIGLRAGVSDALSIGAGPKRATRIPFVSTGSARHNLLVMSATKALAIDPDLVDAGGSRLDELLRVHMPRILETHAEASRRAGLKTGDAAIQAIRDADARLDEALASIGTSIQEAVERLNHESAQALITEVRFLNLRRGEGAATALVA